MGAIGLHSIDRCTDAGVRHGLLGCEWIVPMRQWVDIRVVVTFNQDPIDEAIRVDRTTITVTHCPSVDEMGSTLSETCIRSGAFRMCSLRCIVLYCIVLHCMSVTEQTEQTTPTGIELEMIIGQSLPTSQHDTPAHSHTHSLRQTNTTRHDTTRHTALHDNVRRLTPTRSNR